MKKPALLVLAAGMGSRYGGLKQLDPVSDSGAVILDYSIYDALRAGFGKVVFVIRRDIEKAFREHISARWEARTDVQYAFQDLDALPKPFRVPEGRVKPWGTGHAVLCAKELLKEPFAVINADDFYGAGGYRLLAGKLSGNSVPGRHCMVGFQLNRTLSEHGSVSRGVCRISGDRLLTEITERTGIVPEGGSGASCPDETGKTLHLTGLETVSMNMWGFAETFPAELDALFEAFLAERGTELKSEFYLPSAVFSLIRQGKASVKVLSSPDSWFGVTYRDDLARVQASIRELTEKGIYPANLHHA